MSCDTVYRKLYIVEAPGAYLYTTVTYDIWIIGIWIIYENTIIFDNILNGVWQHFSHLATVFAGLLAMLLNFKLFFLSFTCWSSAHSWNFAPGKIELLLTFKKTLNDGDVTRAVYFCIFLKMMKWIEFGTKLFIFFLLLCHCKW